MSVRDKLVAYPLDFNVGLSEIPSWVDENEIVKKEAYFPIGKDPVYVVACLWEELVEIFDQKGDTHVIAKAKEIFKNIANNQKFKFDEFYYIFEMVEEKELLLVGKRSRKTFDMFLETSSKKQE